MYDNLWSLKLGETLYNCLQSCHKEDQKSNHDSSSVSSYTSRSFGLRRGISVIAFVFAVKLNKWENKQLMTMIYLATCSSNHNDCYSSFPCICTQNLSHLCNLTDPLGRHYIFSWWHVDLHPWWISPCSHWHLPHILTLPSPYQQSMKSYPRNKNRM